jgi:hypothetical protein
LSVRGAALGAPCPPNGGGERAGARWDLNSPQFFRFWKNFAGYLWKTWGKIERMF